MPTGPLSPFRHSAACRARCRRGVDPRRPGTEHAGISPAFAPAGATRRPDWNGDGQARREAAREGGPGNGTAFCVFIRRNADLPRPGRLEKRPAPGGSMEQGESREPGPGAGQAVTVVGFRAGTSRRRTTRSVSFVRCRACRQRRDHASAPARNRDRADIFGTLVGLSKALRSDWPARRRGGRMGCGNRRGRFRLRTATVRHGSVRDRWRPGGKTPWRPAQRRWRSSSSRSRRSSRRASRRSCVAARAGGGSR